MKRILQFLRTREIAAMLAIFLAVFPCVGSAQMCPKAIPDNAALSAMIKQSGNKFVENDYDETSENGVDVIYRSAAIGGNTVVPALRQLARPGYSPSTIPGAAQIALAKLGDAASFTQIEQEFRRGGPYALQKLSRIGGDRSVAILMNALLELPVGSSSGGRNDVIYVPQLPILEALRPIIRNPPAPFGAHPKDLDVWRSWWRTNKDRHVALSIQIGGRPFRKSSARMSGT